MTSAWNYPTPVIRVGLMETVNTGPHGRLLDALEGALFMLHRPTHTFDRKADQKWVEDTRAEYLRRANREQGTGGI